MSEKPKGGFKSFEELPEEFIKSVEKFAVDESEIDINEEDLSSEQFQNLIKDNAPKPPKSVEDTDKRAGGYNQRKKAAQLLSDANLKDSQEAKDNETLAFEKSKSTPENKKRTNKRIPKKGLKEVDFDDGSELKVRMPNPEDIETQYEGLDFDSYDKYNEKKLKTKDILSATSIEDLLQKIDASEGIQGSQEYFNKDQLKMIIEGVRDGELEYDYITRSGRLRQKVFDLLQEDAKKNTPPPLPPLPVEEVVEEELTKPVAEEVVEEELKPLENEPSYLLEEEFIKPVEKKEVVKEVEEVEDEFVLKLPKNKTKAEKPVELEELKEKKPKTPRKKPVLFVENEEVKSEKSSELIDEINTEMHLESREKIRTKLPNSSALQGVEFNFESEKNIPEKKEVKNIEKELKIKRDTLILAHKKSEILEKEFEAKMKNPFRKFAWKAFGVGVKEHNAYMDRFEQDRLNYQKAVDDYVDLKVEQRFEDLNLLDEWNPEKIKYSSIGYSDLKPYLKKKPNEQKYYFDEYAKYDDISLNLIQESNIFSKEELQSMVEETILKKIRKEVKNEVVSGENKLTASLMSN